MFKYTSLLIFLLTFLPNTVLAQQEEFFPSGDVTLNRYYDALGYTVGSVPLSGHCPNCIQYDDKLLRGSDTTDALGSVKLFDVAQKYQGTGLRRMSNILDSIALPPNSRVDFVYCGFNDTGDDVYINSLKVFLSRYYQSQGDISKVVDITGNYENISVLYYNYLRPRVGLVKTYPGLGIVRYSGSPLNPFVLDSVYVKSPLVFRNWKYTEGGEMEITVENISESALKNVKFEHWEYEEMYSFAPSESHTFKYSIPSGVKDLGIASISDPNSQEECVVYSETLESQIVGDSTPLLGTRVQNGISKNYLGSRVLNIELGKSFCIKRIPYKLFSGEMKVKESSDEQDGNEKEVVKEEEFDTPEVKGIKKLPQTSVQNVSSFPYLAVVAYIFLWYYLYRRIKHES